MSGLFGGGGGSTQQVVQKSDPWSGVQPQLKDIAGKAQGAYNDFIAKGYNMPFAGPRSAGQNPYDTSAINSALTAIPGVNPSQSFDLGNFFNNKVMSGAYTAPGNMAFDSGTNQSRDDAIMASVRPIMQNFSENMAPKLDSAAIQSGAYGGTRDADVKARALRDTQQNIGDTAAKVSYQDFITKNALDQQDLAQRRQLMPMLAQQELSAGSQVPGFNNSGFQQSLEPSQIYNNVADKTRGFSQQGINDQMSNWNDLINSPFAGLGDYSGLINGMGQLGGTKSSTTSSPSQGFAPWLQGLAGAGSMMSGISGLTSGASSLFGMPALTTMGMNAGLPAAAISALSFLSDIRVKENVVFAGIKNGFKVYKFNYIWDKAKKFLGVMAQDILYHPAVENILGLYTVDYAKLGFEMEAL